MEPTTKGPHRNPTPKGCDPRIPRVCFFIFAFDLRVQPIGKWWTYFCICIHNQNLKHVYVIRMMPNSSGFFPNILTKQEPISRVQCNSNIKFEPSNFRNSKIDIYNWFFQTLDDVKWKSDEFQSFIAQRDEQSLFWSVLHLMNWYYNVVQNLHVSKQVS
jgi:hypothetical protein